VVARWGSGQGLDSGFSEFSLVNDTQDLQVTNMQSKSLDWVCVDSGLDFAEEYMNDYRIM
jgi:hypothetical protein